MGPKAKPAPAAPCPEVGGVYEVGADGVPRPLTVVEVDDE